jgi:ABC-type branched-subunit amino acid transport system ATPase component/branched-subunit amino acid ABC-type transport system permease component
MPFVQCGKGISGGRADAQVKELLQFAVIGLGAGACYALLAQGAVLLYRGSGVVNFAHGALAMLAGYVTFVELTDDTTVNRFLFIPGSHFLGDSWPTWAAVIAGIAAAAAASFLFQRLVLHRLRNAAPIVRLISTLAALAVVQAFVVIRYGQTTQRVGNLLPDGRYLWFGINVQEERLIVIGIAVAVTALLWWFAKHTRVGLAITASAQNERALATLGWSTERLSMLTWTAGGALAGLAGVLIAPFTGLTPVIFTLVVTIAGLAAALLGAFESFPLTLLGGLLLGVGEALMTNYQHDVKDFLHLSSLTGAAQAVPFLVILLVLVVRGRALPLRSHVSDVLPRLGTGVINWPAIILGAGVTLAVALFVLGDNWAAATYLTLAAGVLIASIIVLTGFAGQLSLAQWTVGGIGALIAGRLVQGGVPMELAILLGILLTVPAGLLFALPALRTRGVNLAVITLGLGFTVSQVVFANLSWIGAGTNGGTRIGTVKLFGVDVNAVDHPQRWAAVCLISLVLVGLLVANLRRSRTGRRLIAVRTNERAAASLGVSVFGVKLYAFGVASAIAAVAGILVGFTANTITYLRYDPFQSINSVGNAVIGGLGYVVGVVFAAPNAIGGLGTQAIHDWLRLDQGTWDQLLGGLLLFVILILHQHGIADLVATHMPGAQRRLLERLRLVARAVPPAALPQPSTEPVPAASLQVDDLVVRFGAVVAVDGVSFAVAPGEVVGLIGPNGAGKTTVIDGVTGFAKPASGSISMGAERIDGWPAARRSKAGLRRSFQSLELFEDISVEDNIRAGSDSTTSKVSWLTDLFWPGTHALSPTATAAIRDFDLHETLQLLPGKLPYGRRRLVGIARAIASGPSVVMLDEPAAGLDEAETEELARLIRRLADERKMGVLLVEHDVSLVMSTCDRVVVLDFGRVIATGTPDEIRGDAGVRAAYLGTDEANETDRVTVAR